MEEERRYVAYAEIEGQMTMIVGAEWDEGDEPEFGILGFIYEIVKTYGAIKITEARPMVDLDWQNADMDNITHKEGVIH